MHRENAEAPQRVDSIDTQRTPDDRNCGAGEYPALLSYALIQATSMHPSQGCVKTIRTAKEGEAACFGQSLRGTTWPPRW